MAHVKKNKRKKNQKKGARMGALKVAHKGRRHRHRGQKKEKVPIRNANAAQEVKPPILISTPQPQPPVTSIAPIAPPPVIPPPLAIPASEPTTPKTVESPPPEILKPLENEDATDKNGKDKAKVNLSPTKTALAPLVVTEIGKKTEGVVKNVEGSHANVLPTIAPVTPFQTPVAETVDGETRNKGSDMDIDGTIDTAPVITTPTATVPAPEPVHSAATEAEKTVEDTAKGIKDPVNPAVPVQILTVAPNIAAPTQTIIKAIGDAAKSVHDGSFLLPTAIPISNAIDDLFGGTTPTLGIIFRTQVDDQHEAPTPVLRMPIETISPSNPREQDRQKRPSPADDDKKDLEDDKKKTKDTTDNETEDEEEEEEKNTEDTTDNDTEDEEEEKEKKTKDTTDNDTEDEEEEKEKKTKDTTDNDTEDEEEEEGKKTGEHHPKDRLKGDREEDEPTEDEGPDGPADGDKAPVPEDDDDDDEGTEEQKEGAHKESKVSPQDSDRVVLDDDGNFVSTQHQALARGTFKAEEKERNNHESDDEENDDEEKSCQPKNKDDIENSTVEKASDKDDSHQDDNVDKKKETKKKTKLHRTTKAHRRPFSSLREVLLKLEMEEAAGLLDPENSDYNISDDIPQENLQAITDHQAAIASTDQDLPLSALRHPPTPEEIKDTEHQGADAFFELLAPEIVLNRKVAQASDREKSEEDKGTTIDTKKEKKSKGKQKKKAKKEKKGKKDKKAEKKGKKNNNHTKSKQRKKDKINALEKRQIPAAPAPIPVAVVGATPVAPLADPQRPPEAPVAQVDDKKMHKDKKVDKVENAADIGFVTQEDMSMIFDLDDGIFPVEDDDDDDEDDDEDEDDDVYFADNADNSQESGLIGAKKHKKGRNGKAVDSIGVMEETEDDKNAGRKDKGMKDKGSEKKDTKSKEINNNKPVHQPHVKQPQQGNAKGGPPGRGEPATPAGAAPAAGGNSVAGGNGAPGYGTVPMFGLSRLDLSNAARSIRGSVLKTVFAAVMVVLVVVM
ncbi:hypothetical protein BGZ59_005878 [Podila verticillata]|nr:hypothetical protein BGZ59_005878 [Podila verticillata]